MVEGQGGEQVLIQPRITGIINYTTQSNDTFDSLALQIYDDEMQAYRIVECNPDYAGMLIFGAGVELKIPIFDMVKSSQSLPPWER